MKNIFYRSLPTKKLPKPDREHAVLLGLVELYLKMGKPIGSSTLQENGFDFLSSATIRNYFSKMEEQGYLRQQHTSGGRIPTEKAYRLYVDTYEDRGVLEEHQEKVLETVLKRDSREIATLIHQSAEALSELAQCAVFISMPRFDQDFVQDVRLIALDTSKLLSVVVTDFGLIRTEPIYVDHPVNIAFLRSCEEYFLWRMSKGEKPLFQDEAQVKLAQRIYNEIMVRHVVGYANFPEADIVRTGLAKLLTYPEFNDATALASSLALLEDERQMQRILQECCEKNEMVVWIGDELTSTVPAGLECSIVAFPYHIHQMQAGAIALLGPIRMPYRNLFGLIRAFSDALSQTLTENLYKYKITFRQAENILLEDKGKNRT